MHVPSLIERKRDGLELSPEEIASFIARYTSGEVPDYQASALAMAIYFRGMTAAETGALTRAMMQSGHVLSHPPGSPPKVDKHSTGGIGDKVSLVLAPLLACDELWVPMVAGRGLGITGGTIDKLESIPGFNAFLPEDQVGAQLARIGVAMTGQTEAFCPADKKLYALRDVTATVPSQPLIVASIMGKKLAESLDRLVLDVKFGSGAFMKTRAEAESLAGAMVAVGREMGVQTSHRLTPMDEPLGCTVGNALEVAEAVEALQGGGPPDLVKLTLDLACQVATAPRERLERWLADGSAWRKFVQMVEAQGGQARDLERMSKIHAAPFIAEFPAPASGRLERLDAGMVGRACIGLGAGRSRSSDPVDFAVGLSAICKTGQTVEKGQCLFRVHARSEAAWQAVRPGLEQAVRIA